MAVKRKINWTDDPSVFLAETYAKILFTDYDDLLKKESHGKMSQDERKGTALQKAPEKPHGKLVLLTEKGL